MHHYLLASLRLCAVSLLVCVVGYSALMLGFAQVLTPDTADGSLLRRADGSILGSRLVAQAFAQPGWFWPRPSAVDYNAAASGGSNQSPTNPDLTARAAKIAAACAATPERPLPPELAAASGSGLDPHLSERAARYQVPRVAAARHLPATQLQQLIDGLASAPGWSGERLVNVLELNLALDGLAAAMPR